MSYTTAWKRRMRVLLAAIVLLGCNPHKSTDTIMTSTGTTTTTKRPGRIETMSLNDSDGGSLRATMPVPVRGPGAIRLQVMHVQGLISLPNMPKEQYEEIKNSVTVPLFVTTFDAEDGKKVSRTPYLNSADRLQRYGIPDPKGQVVGRFDDPRWITEAQQVTLRARILAALDVLLPLFDNPTLSWTEQANLAAREVRDFFPVAAEPGLWPYYKAEGKEFFAWVEKNAPPGKVPLPWEPATR